MEGDQKFKDFLKVCLMVVTLGVAALFESTTLQSTHKKNFESFKDLVANQKQAAQNKGGLNL